MIFYPNPNEGPMGSRYLNLRHVMPGLRLLAAAWICALCFTVGAGSAQAQETASADSRAAILEPLQLTKVRDLDFGGIIAPVAGTVVLTPDPTPVCTESAGLVHSGACQAAVFGGVGQSGRYINIRVPIGREITLTGPGADMMIEAMTVQGSPDLALWFRFGRHNLYQIVSPTGVFLFRIGGTLNIGNNQAAGLYTGTFTVDTVYY